MSDQRIAKWTVWCERPIQNSILTMNLQRSAWDEVGAIIDRHGNLPNSYWWEFMHDTYGTTQAMAVRRQADIHRDVASLGKLISEISEDASRLRQDWWLGMWSNTAPQTRKLAEVEWHTRYGGDVGHSLDPAIPAADLKALSDASRSVKTYADKHIAHAEASAEAPTITLTLKEVHAAVDVVGRLFSRYLHLLTVRNASLTPHIAHNWTAIFREPWIRPQP